MATNKSMIKLLERLSKRLDEISAINKTLKLHIGSQKRQKGQYWNDKYIYNKVKKKIKRVYD